MLDQTAILKIAENVSSETSHASAVCIDIIKAISNRCYIEVLETGESEQRWADQIAELGRKAETLCGKLRGIGFDVSVKGAELSKSLGVSERELRFVVSLARKQLRNMTIISGSYGYKLTADPDKIQESVDRITKHSISQLIVAGDMRRGMPVGQMRLL